MVNLNDPDAPAQSVTVDVITTFMMRYFLIDHFSWGFISPEIGQGDWATLRFADMYNDFIAHKLDDITRAVRAFVMEYNPALTYFKHEFGTMEDITYGRTNVTNSGGMSNTHTKAGYTVSDSMNAADDDGYRAANVGNTFSEGTAVTTTTSVSTYDDDDTKDLSTTTNSGDTASLSGSTQSAKSTDSGNDTHDRDLRVDGSDALHTTIQMIQAELDMRLKTEIGEILLQEFAKRYLFFCGV